MKSLGCVNLNSLCPLSCSPLAVLVRSCLTHSLHFLPRRLPVSDWARMKGAREGGREANWASCQPADRRQGNKCQSEDNLTGLLIQPRSYASLSKNLLKVNREADTGNPFPYVKVWQILFRSYFRPCLSEWMSILILRNLRRSRSNLKGFSPSALLVINRSLCRVS